MKAGLLTALGTNECTVNENVHAKELKYIRTRTTNGNARTLQLVLIHTFCPQRGPSLSLCLCVCVCVYSVCMHVQANSFNISTIRALSNSVMMTEVCIYIYAYKTMPNHS